MNAIAPVLRLLLPALLLSLIAATSAPAADVRPAPEPTRNPRRQAKTPNIVLILADDLGYGDLGCYGQTKILTPNIDRLAAEGMRFTQAYAGNTVCAPSRCALMTGKHSGHGRVRSNVQVPLEPGDVTIAEVLKSAGYHCGAFGKWALGWEGTTGIPNRQGFEEWLGYLDQAHAHDYYPAMLWRNEDLQYALPGNQVGKRGDYAPNLFQKAAGNFIRVNEDDPFFLYFPTTLPHANNERGTNGMEVPSLGAYAKMDWPEPEKAKAAMISRLDAFVGALMEDLKQRKLDQDTLILFTSDNGPHQEGGVDPRFFASSGPFRGIKRDLYEGGIRVPLIARWPGRIKPGAVNALPVASWDLLPTLADLVDRTPPKDIDGISVLPTFFGATPKRAHGYLYWESHEKGYLQAVREGDWKAVKLDTDKPLELYELATDPAETQDVAKANPDVVKRLAAHMKTAADPWTQPEERSPFTRQK